MPFTSKLDANGTITRAGRIGAIIRQLKDLSGRSSVHYQNSTRQFVITAHKREFCEATQRAIEAAMGKLASEIQSGRTTGSQNGKQNDKQNGKQNGKGDRPDNRKTGTFQVPPNMNPRQLLALQKSFGRIGRSLGNGCYLTATTSTIQIKANTTRAIALAKHELQNRISEITASATSKKPVEQTKKVVHNITGQFDALRQVEADQATAEAQQAAAAAAERKDLQETLNQWTTQARLGGHKRARSVGSKMHQVRCDLAEQKGVEAHTISDRQVQAEMRKQELKQGAHTKTTEEQTRPKVYQASTGPATVQKARTTGKAWATAAAKKPETPETTQKVLSAPETTLKVLSASETTQKGLSASETTQKARSTRFGIPLTGTGWGDDDEDDFDQDEVERRFLAETSAFEDEFDALPTSA